MPIPDPTVPAWPNLVPARVGVGDVHRIEMAAMAFRAMDYQYGGGSCRHAVLDRLFWAHRLLGVAATDPVADRLCTAVADLHSVAGWTLFDTGLAQGALRHFAWGLELARQGGDDAMVAGILYRSGRVYLHHDVPGKALEVFQRGRTAARAGGSELACAILSVNEAWAYAKMGRAEQALALLGRATEEFTGASPAETPAWARFFDAADLSAMLGTVHAELACTVHVRHTRPAIPALSTAITRYAPDMARSRSFSLIMLATSHLIDGDVDHAGQVGAEAVALCESVKSTRTKDRLRPLTREAGKHGDNADVRALSERIAAFTATRPGCGWGMAALASQPCTPNCVMPCLRVWSPQMPAVSVA